jgi:chromosome segregation ATPase
MDAAEQNFLSHRVGGRVAAHGIQIANWKTHYEEVAKALEMQAMQLQDASSRLLEIMRERDHLQLRNNELQAQVKAHQRKEKPLNPKERSSVLTLIISMAIKSYGYDPQKSHNAAIIPHMFARLL